MLFKDNLNCILECEKCITSSYRVRVGAQLLEVKLQCSLGEAIGEPRDFLKVLFVAVTGGSLLLLLLAISTLRRFIFLLSAFSFCLSSVLKEASRRTCAQSVSSNVLNRS